MSCCIPKSHHDCFFSQHPGIGIVLIGRAGPGVNNVIQGLYDNLQAMTMAMVEHQLGDGKTSTWRCQELASPKNHV